MPLVFGRSILGFGVVAGPPASIWTDPDLTNAGYDNVSFSVKSEETNPHKIWIKDDGLKMYVLGIVGDDINEYSLSTAWDITTASFTAATSVASEETNPHGFFFKPDGTKMYLTGSVGDDVNEYDLTTAWDSTTLSHVRVQSVSAQDTGPQDVWFNTDGTKMFIVGFTGSDINEYSLSTAWDVSTISYTRNFSVSAQASGPRGIFMNPDGTKMWIIENTSDEVHEYDLTTGFDLSTASYNNVQFSVTTEESSPIGLYFKNDGSKMYIIGGATDAIYQYSTVGWTNPNLATASYDSVSGSVSTDTVAAFDLFFKPDGTKVYITDNTPDEINEYNLTTSWDLSTLSYVQNFSVSTQDTNASGAYFKPDGTKMYVTGSGSDGVYEYDLSTAWDISTATHNQTLTIALQENTPRAIYFKPDGTKMFITGQTGDEINEYSLSTAWDISTATHTHFESISTEETSPQGLFLSPNGDKLYVVGAVNKDVFQYTLTTPWDISTMSYDSVSFDPSTQEGSPLGLSFKSDGSKMYIIGLTNAIYQYST